MSYPKCGTRDRHKGAKVAGEKRKTGKVAGWRTWQPVRENVQIDNRLIGDLTDAVEMKH